MSSAAIRPARAPASIAMLQTVIRRFHRQRADRRAAELDRVPGAAGGADAPDDREHHVLRGHAAPELAVDADQHRLRALHEQALRGEHVLDLGGADAPRERAERAVRAGVRVAAHDGHAGQRRAGLRTDHVHDALARVEEREVGLRAERADVRVERLDLRARDRVLDALGPVARRRVVVGRRDDRRGAPRLAAGEAQPLVRLRARHLVHQVAVDVDQRGAVGLGADDVAVEQLVVERAAHDRVPGEIIARRRRRSGGRPGQPRRDRVKAGGERAGSRQHPPGEAVGPRDRTARAGVVRSQVSWRFASWRVAAMPAARRLVAIDLAVEERATPAGSRRCASTASPARARDARAATRARRRGRRRASRRTAARSRRAAARGRRARARCGPSPSRSPAAPATLPRRQRLAGQPARPRARAGCAARRAARAAPR